MKIVLQTLSVIFVLLVFALSFTLATTPSAKTINDCLVTKMHKVSLCSKNRDYVRLNDVSAYFKNLLLIAEDSAFYQHKGFDWEELENSFLSNLKDKKISRGGSTITQQLAKNVYLNFDRTLTRKFREAILAAQIEKQLSKNQILEKYINVIEFGKNIFGLHKAARHYFNKHPSELGLLESAYLVYLIPNPRVHSQTFKNQKLTDYSRYRILDLIFKLYKTKRIQLDDYLAAKEVINLFPWNNLTATEVPSELSVLENSATSEDETNLAPVEAAPSAEEALSSEDFYEESSPAPPTEIIEEEPTFDE